MMVVSLPQNQTHFQVTRLLTTLSPFSSSDYCNKISSDLNIYNSFTFFPLNTITTKFQVTRLLATLLLFHSQTFTTPERRRRSRASTRGGQSPTTTGSAHLRATGVPTASGVTSSVCVTARVGEAASTRVGGATGTL